MAVSEKKWKAEAKFDTCDGHSDHRMGHECAPAELKAEHACAFGFRVHVDGSRSGEDCGDCFCVEG